MHEQYKNIIKEFLKPNVLIKKPKGFRKACTACVLKVEDGEMFVLFMKRASRKGDPWSGHISFPGGHVDDNDSSDIETCVRETREELGFDMSKDFCYLGHLNDHWNYTNGRIIRLIGCHVFLFEGNSFPAFELQTSEVQFAFWIPISYFQDPVFLSLKYELNFPFGYKKILGFPGIPLEVTSTGSSAGRREEILWGLTLRLWSEILPCIYNTKVKDHIYHRTGFYMGAMKFSALARYYSKRLCKL